MKKKIGFFGGDSQIGTTMLAQSFAEELAEKGLRVLLIFGSGKAGDMYVNLSQDKSIDDLKASIRSGKVEREEFFQTLEHKKTLWMLPSVRNPFVAKYYPENTYEVLMESVEDYFDYVVFDGGSDVNLGLWISALNICQERYFVTTQQAKSVIRFKLYQKQILEPLQVDGMLIINKYMKDPALYLKSDILRILGRQEALLVPYIEYGWQAEMEGKTLLEHKRFERALASLVEVYEPTMKKERKWTRNFV